MNNSSGSEPWFIDRKSWLLPSWAPGSGGGGVEILDAHHIIISLIVNIGLQFCCFLITVIGRVDKIKDGMGGMVFCVVALMTLFLAQTFQLRQLITTVLVCVWAIRLSTYLVVRAACMPSPARTDHERSDDIETIDPSDEAHPFPRRTIRFAVFWTIQAVWVFVVSLPVVLINSPVCTAFPDGDGDSNSGRHLSDRDSLGIVMWSVGFLVEFFADIQKFRFRQKLSNEDDFCTDDLWTWSRHPNYFGEMMQCPILVTGVLLFWSMPALEQHSDVRFGKKLEYQEYKLTTSPVIPMPPELYVKFPHFIQMLLLFEFPLYDHIPEEARPKQPEDTVPKAVRRLDMPY
ncbi:hypothetical protein BV898_04682 [Hypsibius exemplaris]|uniref:Steroid 5-alpha reductase C-terminal domain-containing protein n=1 Tax=Hypsibius exemplaris TaxID=2072580 RepID=A0A1W0X1Y7_HYPEX|nr:hypothetical protein BV898_04682 [Hypsibius exemplaris]